VTGRLWGARLARVVPLLAACLLTACVLASTAEAQGVASPGWTTARLSAEHPDIVGTVVGTTALFTGEAIWPVPVDTVDVYDQTSGRWTTGHLSEPRDQPTLLAAGQQLLVVGGTASTGSNSRALDVFDTSIGRWTGLTLDQPWPPPAASARPPLVVGHDVVFPSPDVVQVYDGTTEKLALARPLHTSDVAPISVSVDSTLLLAGRGTLGDGSPRGIDVFDSSTGAWTTTIPPVAVSDGAPAELFRGGTAAMASGAPCTKTRTCRTWVSRGGAWC
jgi:hypothetical protein